MCVGPVIIGADGGEFGSGISIAICLFSWILIVSEKTMIDTELMIIKNPIKINGNIFFIYTATIK
jgi:hypothetical protein